MLTNIHVHTPFSYSAFRSIEELVDTAHEEGISVLGINDLNTADGFNEFSVCCKKRNIFPVFNIEFTINEISLPASVYCLTGKISGKALPFPLPFPGDVHNLIASIWKGSQDRIWKIIDQLNQILTTKEIPVSLDYQSIRSLYSNSSVHEQHVALALFNALIDYGKISGDYAALLAMLFDDPAYNVPYTMSAVIRQDIVKKLLSNGKAAWIPLPEDTILTVSQAKQLIIRTGGIPCFQCTLDDSTTSTEHVAPDPSLLEKYLVQREIAAIEFIPNLTTVKTLRNFMQHFQERHFCVSIGTGHFASKNRSTIPVTRDGSGLTDDLLSIGYEGACILAAHHEQRIGKQPGFIDEQGKRIITPARLPAFISAGNAIIQKTLLNPG